MDQIDTLQSLVLAVPNSIWITFVCILAVYIWGTYPYTQLKYLGIPGPKPTPIMGNLPDLKKKGHAQLYIELINKYGKVLSFYTGRYPGIVVADPEVVRQIMTKEFATFTNRSKLRAGDNITSSMVLHARDAKWKFLRTMLSPNFTAKKLRGMTPLIHIAISNLEKRCEAYAESGDEVNMNSLFGGYTMDVIASTSFGIKVDSQNDADNIFVKNARKIIQTDQLNFIFLLNYICNPLFKFINSLLFNLMVMPRKFFVDFCWLLLGDRRKDNNNKYNDLLQMMIDTQQESNPSEETNGAVEKEAENTNQKMPIFKKRKFTDEEIIAQCIIFFLAGYETTASTLSFMAHSLALNPDIQKKIQDEIKNVLGDEPADYENIQKLTYLDQCVSETLRKYPIATRVVRETSRDITIKNWNFPKNAEVIIPIYAIHQNPEYWPEPEKFDPERFSPEAQKKHVPFTYLPFGGGPRICIGLRLAQLELKMAIIQILRKFKFVPCEKTEYPIEFGKGPLLAAKNGITLKIEKV